MDRETQMAFDKLICDSINSNIIYYTNIMFLLTLPSLCYFYIFAVDPIFDIYINTVTYLSIATFISNILVRLKFLKLKRYTGVIIYISWATIILNHLRVSRARNISIDTLSSELTLFFALISFVIIQNPKIEIILCILYQTARFFIKLKYNEVRFDTVIDLIFSVVFFCC